MFFAETEELINTFKLLEIDTKSASKNFSLTYFLSAGKIYHKKLFGGRQLLLH